MPRKTIEYIGTKPIKMPYMTRRLLPGELYTCSGPAAKSWLATKKFQTPRPKADLPPPPADLTAKVAPPSDLALARADYRAKFGKGPGPKWTVEQIREKIAAE